MVNELSCSWRTCLFSPTGLEMCSLVKAREPEVSAALCYPHGCSSQCQEHPRRTFLPSDSTAKDRATRAQNSNKLQPQKPCSETVKMLGSCLFKNWRTSCEKLCWLPGKQAVNNSANWGQGRVRDLTGTNLLHGQHGRGARQKGMCSCSRLSLFTLHQDLPSVQHNNAHTRNQGLSDGAWSRGSSTGQAVRRFRFYLLLS